MFARLFLTHPRSVDETYFEHLLFASKFAATLMLAAMAALVHALVPALFDKTASRIVAQLYDRTHNRGASTDPQRRFDGTAQSQQTAL